MSIAYIRKTEKPVSEVVERLKKEMQAEGIDLVGEKTILKGKGILVYFLKPSWTEKIVVADPLLAGLVPSVMFVEERDGKTAVGTTNPRILGGSPEAEKMEEVIEEMDRVLRNLVKSAAGVGDPKIEKVKLYSTATCPYCKMEKDYLEKHKISFDLLMVDENRAAGEEMVRKTGQMGVPVTEIVFDDGESEIVTGFDKDRLNDLLSIAK